MHTGTWIALAVLGQTLGASPAQTWTVDDNGPADFASIQSAIDAVAPGDVLLIQPGDYAPFTLAKELALLGPAAGPKPHVAGRSAILGAPTFTLAGLHLDALSVGGVPGRASIDACLFDRRVSGDATLALADCDELVLSRSTVQPLDCFVFHALEPGVRIANSRFAIVESTLVGAPGCIGGIYEWGDGGHALVVSGGTGTLSATAIYGGDAGGECGAFGCAGCCSGAQGTGLSLGSGARIVARGAGQWIQGGHSFNSGGLGIRATDAGTKISVSGYSIDPVSITGGAEIAYAGGATPEPLLALPGLDVAGATRSLELYGTGGVTGLVYAALGTGYAVLPGLDGSIWLDAGALEFVVALTPPANLVADALDVAVPPLAGLAGLRFTAQAVCPTQSTPAGMLLTNPVELILRF
ncbi:MAG: hypothetical protein EPO68_06465 [Planctomycetota bacterium]|nr:MAG: hypothetical protein EPO68_06465 [Planctomycetota bacterium]